LTNITLAVLIFKIASAPVLDWGVISAMFLALVSYNAKKGFARDRAKKSVEDTDKLVKLEAEVKSLIATQNLKGLR
jgi:hypothetical protein